MTVHCGFFNSVNHDRLYSNKDFINLFNGMYTVGIFQNYGQGFRPIIEGNNLFIGSGMAWLGNYWFVNDHTTKLNINTPFDDNTHYIGIEIDSNQRIGYFTSRTRYEYHDLSNTLTFYGLYSWHCHGEKKAYSYEGFNYESRVGDPIEFLGPVKSALDPKNKIEVDIIPNSSIKSILD